MLNSPGTIDCDYRGEVQIILANLSDTDFVIQRGMRIAQMVLAPVWQAQWQLVDDLDATVRGAGGFGFVSNDRGLPAAPAPCLNSACSARISCGVSFCGCGVCEQFASGRFAATSSP